MRILIALSVLTLACTPAMADTLIWQSSHATCKAVENPSGRVVALGYKTIHRAADGSEYTRMCDFLGDPDASGLSDIGIPADGSWPVNMGGAVEATHAKILPNGHIQLY